MNQLHIVQMLVIGKAPAGQRAVQLGHQLILQVAQAGLAEGVEAVGFLQAAHGIEYGNARAEAVSVGKADSMLGAAAADTGW